MTNINQEVINLFSPLIIKLGLIATDFEFGVSTYRCCLSKNGMDAFNFNKQYEDVEQFILNMGFEPIFGKASSGDDGFISNMIKSSSVVKNSKNLKMINYHNAVFERETNDPFIKCQIEMEKVSYKDQSNDTVKITITLVDVAPE